MSKSKTEADIKRVALLSSLIDGMISPDHASACLKDFPFDSCPLVTLRTSHIYSILNKFIKNEISANYVEEWANCIEMRDDIDYEIERHDDIMDIITQLANPVLFGSLDVNSARKMLFKLR